MHFVAYVEKFTRNMVKFNRSATIASLRRQSLQDGHANNAFGFDLIGFDLDGTLIDTSATLARAASAARAELGYPPVSKDQIRRMITKGAAAIVTCDLHFDERADSIEVDYLRAAMLRRYEADIAIGSELAPGSLAALDALEDLGVPVAIVTNKTESLALKLLREMDLAHRFRTVLGTSSLAVRKPKPDPYMLREMVQRCVAEHDMRRPPAVAYVGDSDGDVWAAKAAGITSIFYAKGFHTDDARFVGADATIDHFDELVPTLRGLSNA